MQAIRVPILILFLALILAACAAEELASTGGGSASSDGPVTTPASDGGGGGGLLQVSVSQRLIVREGELRRSVDDVPQAVSAIADIADAHGGRVQSSSIEGADGQDGARVTLRVPAERFDEVMDAVKRLGDRVLSEETSSQD